MIVPVVRNIKINILRVPQAIRNDTHLPLILDCDYSFDSYDDIKGFVLKWYFNHDYNTVYQWIPPRKPQALNELRDEIDLNFAINAHPYKKYRALKIINPTTKLAGRYKCSVSTFSDEDFSSKVMIIYGMLSFFGTTLTPTYLLIL